MHVVCKSATRTTVAPCGVQRFFTEDLPAMACRCHSKAGYEEQILPDSFATAHCHCNEGACGGIR